MALSENHEYQLVQQLVPDLKLAVQDDICEISDLLLSRGMITDANHEEFTNPVVKPSTRAYQLVKMF